MEETKDWLNEDFLKILLKVSIEDNSGGGGKDPITVDYKVERALEAGKNYSSRIYRIEVLYKHNEEVNKKCYIAKRLVDGVRSVVDFMDEKEAQTYKALPEIERYSNGKFSAKFYLKKEDILVFEDLCEQGFKNAEVKLLDFDHCVLALKNLAKFHAGSLLLQQKNPELLEETIGFDIYANNPKVDIIDFVVKNFNNFGQEISTWPESKDYAEVFSVMSGRLRQYFKNTHKRKVKTLCHGDFWMNNMMFRYENGKVCECRIVDFQACRLAPHTCDFQYFIGSSPDFDVRCNRLDELITVYLVTFNDTLADLGLPQTMSREQFEEDLKEDYFMYFMGMMIPLTAILQDQERTFTFEKLDLKEDLKETMIDKFSDLFKSREYRKFVPPVLDYLNGKGVFQRFEN